MTPDGTEYFLGQATEEHRRLQQQAGELADESALLFDRIGISSGCRAVEIGCGPQGCLELLSDRVGPSGSVVGIEVSGDSVALARRFLEERGITNVKVRQSDARATGLPRQSFDLATARLVLVNIPEPGEVVAEMAALVTRGGVVALHEADYVAHLCDPPLPEWDRLMRVLEAYSGAHGIDLFIGRRVARMLREAGLEDVRAHPVIHLYGPGHSRRLIFLQFVQNLRDRIVNEGLISESELTACSGALERHLSDPATVVVSHLFIQAWGRKP